MPPALFTILTQVSRYCLLIVPESFWLPHRPSLEFSRFLYLSCQLFFWLSMVFQIFVWFLVSIVLLVILLKMTFFINFLVDCLFMAASIHKIPHCVVLFLLIDYFILHAIPCAILLCCSSCHSLSVFYSLVLPPPASVIASRSSLVLIYFMFSYRQPFFGLSIHLVIFCLQVIWYPHEIHLVSRQDVIH